MKRLLLPLSLATALASAGGCARVPPDPQEAVRQMLEAYRSVKSFESESRETVVQQRGEERQALTVEHHFVYEAPNRFRYDLRDKGQTRLTLVSDGRTVRYLHSGALIAAAASPALSGSDELLLRMGVQSREGPMAFIMGLGPPHRASARAIGDETIDGVPTDVVELAGSPQSKVTFWIGQKDHLLRRERRAAAAEQSDVRLTQQTTIDYHDIKVNQQVAADNF